MMKLLTIFHFLCCCINVVEHGHDIIYSFESNSTVYLLVQLFNEAWLNNFCVRVGIFLFDQGFNTIDFKKF